MISNIKNVLEYLEEAADKYPDRIALDDGTDRVTYREYVLLARRIGHMLRENKAGKYVGVVAKRDVYTPVLFMGVLYGGSAYVPLEPDLSEYKRNSIISNSKLDMVIDGQAVKELMKFEEHFSEKFDLSNTSDDAPLYVIYTSGSTGEPKGVVKTHNAMIDFVESFVNRFKAKEHEIVGNQTPFSFDASAKDIYLSLRNAATLQIIPTSLFSFPVKLINYLNEKKVTTICWVPSALSMISAVGALKEIKPYTLKNVFFVGETFPIKQLNIWRKELPKIRYVNLYGSSEIAGVCCSYEVEQEDTLLREEILPIGKPFDNTKIILHNGEIYISSKALFTEYLGDKEKTVQSFVDLTGEGGRYYFKTGDMAHYNEAGNLVFTSRADHQIKHMGYRIELEEIETVALSLDEIIRCGCVYDNKKRRIMLFCQCSGCDAQTHKEEYDKKLAADISVKLKALLAAYMIPKVVIVREVPVNANGKVDRKALAKLI